MSYGRFFIFTVTGAAAWVGICALSGFFSGSHAVVKEDFAAVLLVVVAISSLPALAGVFQLRTRTRGLER